MRHVAPLLLLSMWLVLPLLLLLLLLQRVVPEDGGLFLPAALQTGLLEGLSWQARPGPESP